MLEILKLRVRPTAVLASNDLTAIGIMGAVYAAGLKVPEDISVVGFDDIALNSFMPPPLTTIRLSRVEIAEFAFTSLYAASQRGRTPGRYAHRSRGTGTSPIHRGHPTGELDTSDHVPGVLLSSGKFS